MLPFALGVGLIPALIVGIILEIALGERYLEIPLVLIGLVWVLIGYQLWIYRTPGISGDGDR